MQRTPPRSPQPPDDSGVELAPQQQQQQHTPPPPPDNDAVAAVVKSASQITSIPEFWGKQTENVRLWVVQVERAARQYDWNDASTAAAAQSRMMGAAASWLQSELILGNDFLEFAGDDGLREALLRRFAEQITQLSAIKALKEISQKQGETIDEFRDRLMVALDRKNYFKTDAEKRTAEYIRGLQSELFSFLGAGMLEELRTRTMGTPHPPTTAEELVLAARAVENEMTNSKTVKTSFAVDELKHEIEAVVKEVVKEQRKTFDKDRKSKRSTRQVSNQTRCYRCQGWAHVAADCPNKEKIYPNRGRGRGRGRGYYNNFRGNNRFANPGYNNYSQGSGYQNSNPWTNSLPPPPNNRSKQVWEIENSNQNWQLPSWSVATDRSEN